MPTLRYVHYDVFTTTAFEGNQLAVFLDARGLTTAQMQTLANEMNFSESTFLLPAETANTDIRMRIFTPGLEMPMAGHPTVGSTFALVHEGVIAPGRERWVFGLNIGPTAVALDWESGRLSRAWMDQGPPELRPSATPGLDVVRAIGGDVAAWTATGLPVLEGSCGAPYFYVPLASRAAVDACRPDTAAIGALRSAFSTNDLAVFVFSCEPVEPGVAAYSRMFAPGAGVFEDPATGSATGPLGAYLVRHGLVPMSGAQHIVSVQGVKMGRPSRLHVRVEASSPSEITRVHVGGAAVRVGEGTISW
jgi:trans-2,3-dihydro-3-hydroxyanthranilate isomerase